MVQITGVSSFPCVFSFSSRHNISRPFWPKPDPFFLPRPRVSTAALETARREGRPTTGSCFFADKEVPLDWSLDVHVAALTFPWKFAQESRAGKTVEQWISRDHLLTLRARIWFSDEIINAYMLLLSGRGNAGSTASYFMSSFFYAKFTSRKSSRHALVETWSRDYNTTGSVKIFVPVNVDDNHWFMIMIDVEGKRILSMDSKNTDRKRARSNMLSWIGDEHKAKSKPFDRVLWAHAKKNVPLQGNDDDCGPFACLCAAFMSNDKDLNFVQADMPKMRRRMAWSILHSEL